jgi:hypothetical protein
MVYDVDVEASPKSMHSRRVEFQLAIEGVLKGTVDHRLFTAS